VTPNAVTPNAVTSHGTTAKRQPFPSDTMIIAAIPESRNPGIPESRNPAIIVHQV
jgi:hypothetical protein